ncbi:MAG: YicC family protein [Rhodospirillaceae bacterium]|nr:YicC family protein [Rhodospirillaceae bacterium]
MTVSSMTGYARAEGALDGAAWFWEARSVNGKGLDVRCRVPPGSDAIDAAARKAASARGALSLSLQLDRGERRVALKINKAALEQVLALQDALGERVDPAPPRLDALIAVRGIAETVEPAEDAAVAAAREQAILATLADALDRLASARAEEGARLLPVLRGHLENIGRLTAAAAAAAEAQPAMLRQRFEQQVAELLEARIGVGEDRLAQEAALLAAKADVREEIDRLASHAAAAGALLDAGGAVGRKLDFLCQELNREANTLCSKAADIALTRIGLDLKAAIEQFREQVQNVE